MTTVLAGAVVAESATLLDKDMRRETRRQICCYRLRTESWVGFLWLSRVGREFSGVLHTASALLQFLCHALRFPQVRPATFWSHLTRTFMCCTGGGGGGWGGGIKRQVLRACAKTRGMQPLEKSILIMTTKEEFSS